MITRITNLWMNVRLSPSRTLTRAYPRRHTNRDRLGFQVHVNGENARLVAALQFVKSPSLPHQTS